jgi:pimeloyl-ACP methyl ester carboxylesterase
MKLRVHGTAGPVVVKLAGIAGGVRLYDEEVEAVASAGFRVITMDVTGDRRDDPAGMPLEWARYADEVAGAIDGAPGGRAVLWGTSFGGMIALATAARYPERVSGLLLTHPPDPLWRPRLYLALLDFARRRAHPDLAVRVMFPVAFLGMTSWEAVSPRLWLRLPSLTRVAIEAATPASTIRQKLELLFHEDPGLPPPAAAIPVEILAGTWDLVAPIAGARRVASRLPGARLHVLGYSGHAGAFARPRAHRELVLDALKRLS